MLRKNFIFRDSKFILGDNKLNLSSVIEFRNSYLSADKDLLNLINLF